MVELSKALESPAAHGFEIAWDNVATEDSDLGIAPFVRVTDVTKFEASFPGVILSALNKSSSPKVLSQGVTRRALQKTRLPNTREARKVLCEPVLRAVLALGRSPVIVERVKYALPDGTFTEDKDAAVAAWKAAK